MECNIDAKGKAARLIWGAVLIVVAVALAALRGLDVLSGGWWWPVAVVLALFGAFGIFEGRKGWCVVRAMGIKTPLQAIGIFPTPGASGRLTP